MLSGSWSKIIGLSTLQGAISLTWLIYNIYLPKLLISYGFSPKLAVLVLIVENAMAMFLEPLFGSLSDRAYRFLVTKFGIIAFGIILTVTITGLIPMIVIFGDVFSAIKWFLPGVLIAWAMAMTVFRAPAISLLGKYASTSELPIAMSFLTVVSTIIGALKPISQNFILSIGAPFAFTLASIVLLAATGALEYLDPGVNEKLPETKRQPIALRQVGLIMIMGLGIAWSSRCLFETLPKMLKVQLPQLDPVILMTVISTAIAISALPGGVFAARHGNHRVMLLGIGATLIGLLGMFFLPTPTTLIISITLFVGCFSWITNGAVPLAINLFPANRSGLAVGLYVGSFSGGLSSFSALFNPVTNLTPLLGTICGSIGLMITAGCILKSLQLTNKNS
jgi:Major Facilitator Superfamily